MIVVDTSAVVSVLTDPEVPGLAERFADERYLHAPYLMDVEVAQVLRRLTRSGRLSVDRAADARVDYASLRVRRYRHVPLLERIWELRDTFTAYDACFVALAEVLSAPLITCDIRIARATGHEAEVELFAPAS